MTDIIYFCEQGSGADLNTVFGGVAMKRESLFNILNN
jgi:hypothetical protein